MTRSVAKAVNYLIVMLVAASVPTLASGQSQTQVSIATADGKSLVGNLVEISDQGVRFDSGGKEAVLSFDELSHIQMDHASASPLPMRVQLAGGSQISGSAIEWANQTVKITPARQSPISLPVQQLRWVRFRTGNSATDPTWLGWLEESRRGDRLVVRRNEKALDSIEGTAVGISPDSVEFETRGNRIAAPLAKLEGILLSNQAGDPAPSAIRLTDTSGSQWAIDSIGLPRDGQQMRIELAGSIVHEIPLDQIREIRFAGGVLSLADAEIASSDFAAESTGKKSSVLAADLDNWFSPRSTGGVIRVHCPGEITFRIPDGYQNFIVAARRGSEVKQFTAVRLDVLLDGKVKWTEVLQDRESLGLELPLAGVRQVTLRAASVSKDDDKVGDVTAASLGGTIEWFSGRLLK